MDCFTDCAEHVHTTVDEVDWKSWGLALAGQCQAEEDKLACADNLIWTKITRSVTFGHHQVSAFNEPFGPHGSPYWTIILVPP